MKAKSMVPIFIVSSLFVVSGCAVEDAASTSQTQLTFTQQKVAAYDWLEHSGEAYSLRLQAYNAATHNLAEIVKQASTKPKAVILDIDETVLNNGPAMAYQIKYNAGFNQKTWNQWVMQGKAKPIPGAVAFTQYAKQLGVAVFYVSNRNVNKLDVTRANLEKYGFADANMAGHILLSNGNQDKQPRFDKIEQNYDVVQFFGDQLTDFGQAFENKTNAQEQAEVAKLHNLFGWKYYSIPNPTYGNWENNMFNHNYKLSEKEKVSIAQSVGESDAFTPTE